jgi:hypothetical protein
LHASTAAAVGVGQDDEPRVVEAADRIARAVIVIVVSAHTGGRHILEEHGLDVPVIVKTVCHVELEARRRREHDAAARVHHVDLLAHRHRVRDGEKVERVAIWNEQDAARVGHSCKSSFL